MNERIVSLLTAPAVVAIGAGLFADGVREQGAPVVQVEWRPPRETDDAVRRALEKLL